MAEEMVDHPRHYNENPSGVECIDVVERMPFNEGNAVKYLWRADAKGKRLEDLCKARWYIERAISHFLAPHYATPPVMEILAHVPAEISGVMRELIFSTDSPYRLEQLTLAKERLDVAISTEESRKTPPPGVFVSLTGRPL